MSNSNTMTTSDPWQTSSAFFPTSFDFNLPSQPSQYSIMDNSNYEYSALPEMPSSYATDPYSHVFNTSYPVDPYASSQTSYSSSAMDYCSSTYFSPADSYQHLHSMYPSSDMPVPVASSYLPATAIDAPVDYPSSMSHSHESTSTKGRCSPSSSRNECQPVFTRVRFLVTSASNSSTGTNASKQPCLVCHEKSSGYHFGAYTCESCKAFYRRVTKDSHVQIKHSCEVPLPNITKSNRKDCRACRKAKCERVGMTVMPKDRPLRTTKSKGATKFPSIPITDLLEQLGRDLIYDQLSSSSAFETLLHLIDLPSLHPMALDYHSLYMDASRLWRNQQHGHPAELTDNGTFAVLLVLFRTFMTLTENNNNSNGEDDKSNDNSKFGKLVSLLQQEIHRLTGTDHRSARRIKALFMKCYVTLAQYSNSTSYLDQNPMSQTPLLAYQPYSAYSQ